LQNSHLKFIEQIRLLYPEASESFFAALQQEPQTSIRKNPFKLSNQFETETTLDWCELAYLLKERPSFIADPMFHAGTYYVQEASSMFLHWVLKQVLPLLKKDSQALKVLDLCAAPGGKSTLIASLLHEHDFLLANEIIKSRLPILRENLQKWGTLNFACSSSDPKYFQNLPAYFDLIVVDAPCSGEGMFRKDEDARNMWSLDNVALCAARQQRILEDVLPSLKEGGILIYSTCTFNEMEDEAQIRNLVAKGYEPIFIECPSNWQMQACENNAFKFPFHLTPGEGFYLACLRKPRTEESSTKHLRTKPLAYCNKAQSAVFAHWFQTDVALSFVEHNKVYAAITKAHEIIWEQLLGTGFVHQVGMPIGELDKNKNLVPSHELALSIFLNKELPSIHLDLMQAKQFLRKDNLQIPAAPLGWQLVKFDGFALGWVKVLGNRINNYLPAAYRVLKAI